jgi:hypothetical protein
MRPLAYIKTQDAWREVLQRRPTVFPSCAPPPTSRILLNEALPAYTSTIDTTPSRCGLDPIYLSLSLAGSIGRRRYRVVGVFISGEPPVAVYDRLDRSEDFVDQSCQIFSARVYLGYDDHIIS